MKALRELITAVLFGTRNDACPRRNAKGDHGSATTDYVLMLAVTIGIAVGVGAIITPMIIDAANSIDLGVE